MWSVDFVQCFSFDIKEIFVGTVDPAGPVPVWVSIEACPSTLNDL